LAKTAQDEADEELKLEESPLMQQIN
jgi:hypothetical protein